MSYKHGFGRGFREGLKRAQKDMERQRPSSIHVGSKVYNFHDYEMKGAPTIVMSAGTHSKIMAQCRVGRTEIGGMTRVEIEPGNKFRILDVADPILQRVTSVHTSLDPMGLAMYASTWLMKNTPEDDEKANQIRCWWHSHCNMPVFWSGTDRSTQDRYGQSNPKIPWFVAVVVNHYGHMLGCVNLYQPFKMTFDNCPIQIEERVEGEKIYTEEEFLEPCKAVVRGFIPNTDYDKIVKPKWETKAHEIRKKTFKDDGSVLDFIYGREEVPTKGATLFSNGHVIRDSEKKAPSSFNWGGRSWGGSDLIPYEPRYSRMYEDAPNVYKSGQQLKIGSVPEPRSISRTPQVELDPEGIPRWRCCGRRMNYDSTKEKYICEINFKTATGNPKKIWHSRSHPQD